MRFNLPTMPTKRSRYKAALNGGRGENYGLNASAGGADLPLVVTEPTLVKFYYDHKTHWITDSINTAIVVAMGDFHNRDARTMMTPAVCVHGSKTPQAAAQWDLPPARSKPGLTPQHLL